MTLINRLFRPMLALGFVAASHAAQATDAVPLNIDLYNPGDNSLFQVSSEILTGQREAILIDAQFERKNAEELVRRLKASGKRLTLVYISHSDPDFYFGLDVIKQAFPDVKIVATPETVQAIKATQADKLAFWGPQMKDQAPKQIVVPEPLNSDQFTLEGQPIKIMGLKGPDPKRTYLWIPSLQTVAGGVIVENGTHVFIADTPTLASRQAWIDTLGSIKTFNPRVVIPGHFVGPMPQGLAAVNNTADYLQTFNREDAKTANAAELINAMKRAYPKLGGLETLELSAKVVKGEMEWPVRAASASTATPSTFPAVGKVVDVQFGQMAFRLTFDKDGQTMSFATTAGTPATQDTVKYTAVQLRPQLYMVYWSEPTSGDQVVHVEDFERGVVYTNIVEKNGNASHLTGTLRVVGTV